MIPLFYPETNYWQECGDAVKDVLKTRWWGQAYKVEEFENAFADSFNYQYCLAVNSCSAALELAYHLIGIGPGDEVITPVLGCTATNIPLLRRKANIIFSDISRDDLLINPDDVSKKITKKTKAIVAVTLGGLPINESIFAIAKENNIPVVIDAAQSVGISENHGDYITYSFQAIKHFSTGDGGMLVLNNKDEYDRAKKLRWFGIDREVKKRANWQAYRHRQMTIDIEEAGYKFHMNDISAALGLVGLKHLDEILDYRKILTRIYNDRLKNCGKIAGGACWLYGVLIDNRDRIADELLSMGVDVNMVHLRNDMYKIFGGIKNDLPNMDWIEGRYLYLPINTHITENQVEEVVKIFNQIIESHG